MARILHISDLHAKRDRFAWLTEVAPSYDLICISGDLLDECSRVPLGEQIDAVTEWLRPVSVPLAVVGGNHDVGDDARRGGAWMRKLAGAQRWVDEAFVFCGMKFSSFGWNVPLPADFASQVVLTHAPPIGTTTARVSRTGADWGNIEWDGRLTGDRSMPQLVLCGHVHEPEQWSARIGNTTIFNPGVDAGFPPKYIVLDLQRKFAQLVVCGSATTSTRW